MLDADAVINNSSQKVGGSNAYQDPTPKKWVGSDPEKHIGSTPLPAAIDQYLPPAPCRYTSTGQTDGHYSVTQTLLIVMGLRT